MFIVMGATGHVGSAVLLELKKSGSPVTAITHIAAHADRLRQHEVDVAVVDLRDVESFRAVLRNGKRAFVLNPPADVATDTDVVERASVRSIVAAVNGSGLEKIVAESSAGAQPGERIGDCNVLWELEQGLKQLSFPTAVNRATFYMSNWDMSLEAVRKTGKLSSMYPADLKLPMVAPADLGKIAASRLMSSIDDVGINYIEGPARYSSLDVAQAFEQALGRPVELVVTPPDQRKDAYLNLGFSEEAGDSYTRMTELTLKQGFRSSTDSVKGAISLDQYIADLVQRPAACSKP